MLRGSSVSTLIEVSCIHCNESGVCSLHLGSRNIKRKLQQGFDESRSNLIRINHLTTQRFQDQITDHSDTELNEGEQVNDNKHSRTSNVDNEIGGILHQPSMIETKLEVSESTFQKTELPPVQWKDGRFVWRDVIYYKQAASGKSLTLRQSRLVLELHDLNGVIAFDGDFGFELFVPRLTMNAITSKYEVSTPRQMIRVIVLRQQWRNASPEEGQYMYSPPRYYHALEEDDRERYLWLVCPGENKYIFGFDRELQVFTIDREGNLSRDLNSLQHLHPFHRTLEEQSFTVRSLQVEQGIVIDRGHQNGARMPISFSHALKIEIIPSTTATTTATTTLSSSFVESWYLDLYPLITKSTRAQPLHTEVRYGEVIRAVEMRESDENRVYHSPTAVSRTNLPSAHPVVGRVDRFVAMKVIQRLPNASDQFDSHDNILTELQVLQFLQYHGDQRSSFSYFLPLHFAVRDSLRVHAFIVTEFFNHGSLLQYLLKVSRTLVEEDVRYIISQIVRALQKMHQYGLAHLDISPENIVLCPKSSDDTNSTNSNSTNSNSNNSNNNSNSNCKTTAHTSTTTSAISTHTNNNTYNDSNTTRTPFQRTFRCIVIDFGQSVVHTFDRERNHYLLLPGRSRLIGKHAFCCPEWLAMEEEFSGFAVDAWQLGVLILVLLYNFNPLTVDYGTAHRSASALFKIRLFHESLQRGGVAEVRISCGGESATVGRSLSKDGVDFLQKLLQLQPSERMSMDDALQHPWLSDFIT